ncbi:hypothetical protein H8E52_07460 [bacterium]|nr:hypothetical protein [bacterium]
MSEELIKERHDKYNYLCPSWGRNEGGHAYLLLRRSAHEGVLSFKQLSAGEKLQACAENAVAGVEAGYKGMLPVGEILKILEVKLQDWGPKT